MFFVWKNICAFAAEIIRLTLRMTEGALFYRAPHARRAIAAAGGHKRKV